MKLLKHLTGVILLSLWIPTSFATITVDSLNYPVWVERESGSQPLSPGDRLRPGDVVQTGDQGRVWLEVEDGSVIKLGRDARFSIDQAGISESTDGSLLDAAFKVLKGAFRFTGLFFEPRRQADHRIEFKVGAITAGVRGTDIWGLSSADEDFVALLEGSIEVSAADQPAQLMAQPLTLYRKAQGQAPDPISAVDMATVQALAPQTELDPAAGIADTVGNYSLVLQSLSRPELVDAALARYRDAGYAVRARPAVVDGVSFTRIQLEGLIHLESASQLRRRMIEAGLIDDAWVNPVF